MFEVFILAGMLRAAPDQPATAEESAVPGAVGELLARADAPRRQFLHSVVSVRATLTTGDKPAVVSELDLYIGDENRQLVVFKDGKAKGRKFLMRGDKSWLLVPGSKHPIAISANQRLFGSMSFADLARVSLAADYNGRLRDPPEPCPAAADAAHDMCRVVDISADKRGVPYASGTLWIDKRDLAVRAVFNLASGKPARSVDYQYAGQDGAWAVSRTVIRDLLTGANGAVTTLEYLDHRHAAFTAETFEPDYALTH